MNRARDDILARLDAARTPRVEPPRPPTAPPGMDDPPAFLRARLEEAGGRLQMAAARNWPDEIEWPLDRTAVRHLHSALPIVPSRGLGLDATTDRELDGLEICILRAEFAVAESGAVWQVPSSPRERVAALLAEHLIVVVDATEIVATLHHAYQRIDPARSAFGWFLCGPSKTADIEQSLVLGAHGPRTLDLIVTNA
ncbi:MAG TPA: hypothetical protein ENI85_15745 [Deltaproteobacteria bacterium]|nr:hypothetical protein [Deltaproteobacteria bacterium]